MASGSPRYELIVVDKFHASHRLSCHKGKCGRDHGHTYRVEFLFLSPEIGASSHMVVDFSVIKAMFREIKKTYFDHHNLNNTMEEPDPTAEYIAQFIYRKMELAMMDATSEFPQHITLEKVTVWETENNAASFSME